MPSQDVEFLFEGGPHSKFIFRQEMDTETGAVTIYYRNHQFTLTREELVGMRDERQMRNVVKTWANIIDKHKRIRRART